MINHILDFRKNLAGWGVDIPDHHPEFHRNAKDSQGYRVCLASYSVELLPNYTDLFVFMQDNHNMAFTTKVNEKASLPRRFGKLIENTLELCERCVGSSDQHLRVLHDFVQALRCADVPRLITQICATVSDKKAYLCLDFDGRVQNELFFEAMHQAEIANYLADCTERDVFGNRCRIDKRPLSQIKFGPLGSSRPYAKDLDTKCFARYGLLGIDACRIGEETQLQIASTIAYVVDPNNEAKDGNSGLWYRFFRGDKRYLVFTNLMPVGSTGIDVSDDKAENYAEWFSAVSETVRAMRTQARRMPDVQGNIIVLRKLKGTCQVEASYTRRLSDIAEFLDQWLHGAGNGPRRVSGGSYRPVSLSGMAVALNTSWSYYRRKKQSGAIARFPFSVVYDFFFNDMRAVREVLNFFVRECVPLLLMLAGISQLGKQWQKHNHLYAIAYLIAAKLGYRFNGEFYEGGSDMAGLAYACGQLFKTADWLYVGWFQCRGQTVPSKLIGSVYAEQIHANVRQALAGFCRTFQLKYDFWKDRCVNDRISESERQEAVKRCAAYDKRMEDVQLALNNLGGKVPVLFDHEATLMFMLGFTKKA
jgi:hypothetical protein